MPRTEEFPPGFRMIAYSDQGSDGIENDGNYGEIFVECCDIVDERESCTETEGSLILPNQQCDFVGFAFGM